jgi:electron transfer flavoprotein alpha subunit
MSAQSANGPDCPDNRNVVVQVLATLEANGQWSAVTFELLGDASVLAKRWGGLIGVFALTAADATPAWKDLAAHGCDAVWHLRHERFRTWSSEAVAATLTQHLHPDCRVFLMPGSARGEEAAALLAERLETTWVPDALTLAVTRSGDLEITAALAGGKLARVHRPTSGRPTIATMRPGVAEARKSNDPRTVDVRGSDVDLSAVPDLTTVEEFLPPDPATVDISFAERIVSAGRGTGGPDGVGLVAGLANALGASLGASRMAVDLGWAPAERQVGQTGRTVRPDLYVACGISGASHHLAGMRDSKHIVAINPDVRAPIHDVAHLSLHGDLRQVIPAIRAALERRLGNGCPGNAT